MARRRPLSRLAERLAGRLFFERHRADPALTRRLREEATALEIGATPDTATAAALWDTLRADLRRLMRTADPEAFLRWPPVRTTMVKRGRGPVAVELRHLRARSDWRSRWRPALRESTLGAPRPFHLLPATSGATIHHAYHLARFEETTGRRLADCRTVVEFGGGYGGPCRLLHRLGFRGVYVIFDLPEVCALQRFYLGHQPVDIAASDRALPERGVVTTAHVDRLAALIGARPRGEAAFMASWSLGESPVALRSRVLPLVESFDHFLVGYTERFLDIDNRAYFAGWRAGLAGRAWHDVPLPHLAKAEWYLFGARTG